MKSKLNYLIGISLKRKMKTKWFILANFLLFIVIAGIINIDHLITFFGGDFNQKKIVYVMDETSSFDTFKKLIEEPNPLSKNEESDFIAKKYNGSVKEIKKKLKNKKEKKNILVTLKKDSKQTLEAIITTKEFLDTSEYTKLNSAIQSTKVSLAIVNSNIAASTLEEIYKQIDVKREVLDENKKSEEESMEMIMTTAFPILILPFFMLTIFLVQMIGAEVNDEKSTRGMEIIISNVSPKVHFFSKVIAGNLFVILQGILLILYAIVGFYLRSLLSVGTTTSIDVMSILNNIMTSSIGEKLAYIIPLTLLLMILTFIAYSLLAGILASMTTNIEDFQQLQTPIMVISIVGYYLAMMAGVFNGALFIRVVSFIPFISAILAPSLLMLGQIGIIEMCISILIVMITIYLLIKYGLRIYKVGILNYSSSGLWKKMFKALKKKE